MRRAALLALALTWGPGASAWGQQADSLLVEVHLSGVGAILILAEPLDGSEDLRLPAQPIYLLAGLPEPPMREVRLSDLEALLQVGVLWSPRQLKLTLVDARMILPASRARLDRLRAEALARPGPAYARPALGPFGSVTVDERAEALVDLGYAGSRFQVRAAHSTVSGTAWSASATPVRSLWLTYGQSERTGPRIGARYSMRGAWVAADYYRDQVELQGTAAMGPIIVYASSRERFAVTWRGDVDVQVGHTRERTAVRLSFGALDPSPLAIPAVY